MTDSIDTKNGNISILDSVLQLASMEENIFKNELSKSIEIKEKEGFFSPIYKNYTIEDCEVPDFAKENAVHIIRETADIYSEYDGYDVKYYDANRNIYSYEEAYNGKIHVKDKKIYILDTFVYFKKDNGDMKDRALNTYNYFKKINSDNPLGKKSTLMHEVKHLQNFNFIKKRREDENVKNTSIREDYIKNVEDERTAHLEQLLYIREAYLKEKDIPKEENLNKFEDSFLYYKLKELPEKNKDEIIKDSTKFMNFVLKQYNKSRQDIYFDQYNAKTHLDAKEKNVDKEYDPKEHQRNMEFMYSFKVYNPIIEDYELKNLYKEIDFENRVQIDEDTLEKIIRPAEKLFTERKEEYLVGKSISETRQKIKNKNKKNTEIEIEKKEIDNNEPEKEVLTLTRYVGENVGMVG